MADTANKRDCTSGTDQYTNLKTASARQRGWDAGFDVDFGGHFGLDVVAAAHVAVLEFHDRGDILASNLIMTVGSQSMVVEHYMRAPVVYLLVVTSGIAMAGCRQQKAVSSSMSPKQRDALIDSLAKLEVTLASKSPFIFDKLEPGANDEGVSKLRSELGGAQIQCLELWYRWHNGCSGNITDVLPLGRKLSISEAIEDRTMIRGIPFVDAKRKNAWKILEDGAGDGFFLDIASPNPRVFYHMLEDPFPRDFGTLQEFVGFINDVHASGLASENEHGMVAFDSDRYEKLEAEYLEVIGDRSE